eukprot:scaffold127247_cov57-Phaeocystis_antarctica.AAC.2
MEIDGKRVLWAQGLTSLVWVYGGAHPRATAGSCRHEAVCVQLSPRTRGPRALGPAPAPQACPGRSKHPWAWRAPAPAGRAPAPPGRRFSDIRAECAGTRGPDRTALTPSTQFNVIWQS